jgi:hypothetical protein
VTDTDGTRYVDPDTWFERLYDPALPDTHDADGPDGDEDQAEDHLPVALTKAEPDDQAEPEADDDDQADGKEPFDLRALADQLSDVLSETPEERDKRRHREREERLAAAGETPADRRQRHRDERTQRQHRASALMRVHHGERTRRFRRWVALTALSASAGYGLHVVQIAARLPPTVAGAALGGSWVLDLWMRRWGKVRVSQVRGVFPLALLMLIRIPVASVLVALLGLAPLLALTNHH